MSATSIIVSILLLGSIFYSFIWFDTLKEEFENEYKLFLKEQSEFFCKHSSTDNEEKLKFYKEKIEKEYLYRRIFWIRASGLLALIPFFFYPRLVSSESVLFFLGFNYIFIYVVVSNALFLYLFDKRIFSSAELINSPKKDFCQIKKLFTTSFEPYISLCVFIVFVYNLAHFFH